MRQADFDGMAPSVQRPSRALGLVLLAIVAIWLAFAVAVNWASASLDAFLLLVGNTSRLAQGELWRLVTAPLMHSPEGSAGVNHVLSTVVGLFFLAPALEAQWGTARLLRFLAICSLFAYATQWCIALALPPAAVQRLVPTYWFGAVPALEAVAVAFALSLKNRNVLLFFVLPIGSRGLLVGTIGLSVALVAADAIGPSGAIAPFAGMLAGWWFGGGTPSPARRWWLRLRLRRLESEARADREARVRLAKRRFEVLPGGRQTDRSDRNLH